MALTGRLIGYARVSTEEQQTDAQIDELERAGCASIIQEVDPAPSAPGRTFANP